MKYEDFIASKAKFMRKQGFQPSRMNSRMRADQKLVTRTALEHGRYAIFADCGLGKTIDELEWSKQVAKRGPVLIVAPLCVSVQTIAMGKEFGYDVNLCKHPQDVKDGMNIVNIDRLQNFEGIIDKLTGICIDESSILKSVDGKMRTFILSAFRRTPFRLACTATAAPNDHMEFGNHAEFLGVCTREEMLAEYFTHDGGETSKWRIKGHAQEAFWRWVNSWSVTYRKPSDLDPKFSDEGFVLPKLEIHQHLLNDKRVVSGILFDTGGIDLSAHRDIRKNSITQRVDKVAALVDAEPGVWVHWCELNSEGDALIDALDGAQQLKGSDDIDKKEEILTAFIKKQCKQLVTKYRITGFGLNFQHCHNTSLGATHSFEQVYQAIKRFHRFGQKKRVNAHFVMMDSEFTVFQNLQRKFDANEIQHAALSAD